jgi:hypothetical protein
MPTLTRNTFFLCAIVLLFSIAHAQSAANGSISGSIRDPQGKLVPGATITVRSAEFGTSRTLVTGSDGEFASPLLPAGTYAIEVAAPGFRPKKFPRVLVSIGTSVHLDVRLQLPSVSQSVTVSGTAPLVEGNTTAPAINKEQPEVGNFFPGLTVTYLPNRDRDFEQFAQLTAGTAPGPAGQGISITGQPTASTKVQVDGADFSDPYSGGVQVAGDNSLFFPQTVVREFEVVHTGATADEGNTNAGYINVLTKTGSNKLHGEGFYIGRPSPLASSDAFGHSLDNAQNEFGGSFGGPIRRDRAFFYIGGEQDFLNVPYYTQFQPQAPGVNLPAGLASLQGQTVQKSRPTALFARTDFVLSSANTLNLQFNYTRVDATGLSPGSSRTDEAASHRTSLTGHSNWGRGNLTTLFGSKTVNQFIAQWAGNENDLRPNSLAPEIVINGFGALGGNGLAPQAYSWQRRALSDDLAFSRSRILVQVGGSFADDPVRSRQEAYLNGRFDFDSLADYLSLTPRRYRQTFVVGNPDFRGSGRELGLYVNAKMQLRSSLALTAGLRWEGQWNPQPLNPNAAIPFTRAVPHDLAQWQPRLGLAWSGIKGTVVRVSAGLYDAPAPFNAFQRVFTDNGLNTLTADSYFDPFLLPLVSQPGLISVPLAAPPAGLSVPASAVVGIAPDFRNPRSFQTAASLQREFNKSVSGTAGFVHNSTWALPQALDQNLFSPANDAAGLPVYPPVRPDPSIGKLLIEQSSAHSTYNGLLLTANWQVQRKVQFMANYTLASARDDAAPFSPFGIDSALSPYELRREAAPSAFDIRHNFNLSTLINLPKGFKVDPVIVARSGAPYTPIVGFDLQNDANDYNDRAILNGAVAGRNSLRQPAFFNLDLRLVKDITLPGEGHHLDLFMDVFNLTGALNRNFGPQSISEFGTAASPLFSAGQALYAPDTNQLGSARQIQFTARIVAF